MKFGLQFEFHKIPEWYSEYLDYKRFKGLIKRFKVKVKAGEVHKLRGLYYLTTKRFVLPLDVFDKAGADTSANIITIKQLHTRENEHDLHLTTLDGEVEREDLEEQEALKLQIEEMIVPPALSLLQPKRRTSFESHTQHEDDSLARNNRADRRLSVGDIA